MPAITWSDDEDGIERFVEYQTGFSVTVATVHCVIVTVAFLSRHHRRNVRHPDARAFDDDIGDELGGTWTKPTSTLVEKPWQPDRPLRSVENVQGWATILYEQLKNHQCGFWSSMSSCAMCIQVRVLLRG